jgi:predicted nucleotidyltransferase
MSQQTLETLRNTYRHDLESALQRIVAALSQEPSVHKIILFGSYAAGRRDLFTDIDLLVVMDSTKDYVTRTANLYASLQAGIDLDLLVYTPDEFENMRQKSFLRNALKHAEVLYAKG